MATIEMIGVRKTFGTTVALDDLHLRVESGEPGVPARPVGLRQDDRAAPAGRLRAAGRRPDPGGR